GTRLALLSLSPDRMSVQRLWTPWRMAFIQGDKPRECIFCRIARERDDRKNLLLYRGKLTFVLLNAYPYTTGHLMIAPYVHVGDLAELDLATTAETMELAKRALRVLRKVERPGAFNVGMNIGTAAGAGIADHVHLHVVPRWE